MVRKDIHQENRVSWNEATVAHNSHKKDQANFFRSGGSTLYPEELDLLRDVRGKSLVHLQCNAGQDTLSLAQLGADVTGVDISDTAIDFARRLSTESAIPAQFIRADVFDWLEETAHSDKRYHVAFSSYGALAWLSDLKEWAKGINQILLRNGRLVVIEFHPFVMIYEWDWMLTYPYFGEGKPLTFEEGIGDYVAMSGDFLAPSGYVEGTVEFQNPYPTKEFQWTVSEILTAIVEAGFTLKVFREYPYMNGARLFRSMRATNDGRLYPPPGFPGLPLMYGLVAIKG
jgi:SAM-dependent methyltransferase